MRLAELSYSGMLTMHIALQVEIAQVPKRYAAYARRKRRVDILGDHIATRS